MFKLVTEPTFRHRVTASVPIDGGFRRETFEATFRVLSPDEVDGFDLRTTKGSTEFLRRVVARLDDVADATGEPIEWSDEVLDQVLRLPWARHALAETYFAAVTGARAGN